MSNRKVLESSVRKLLRSCIMVSHWLVSASGTNCLRLGLLLHVLNLCLCFYYFFCRWIYLSSIVSIDLDWCTSKKQLSGRDDTPSRAMQSCVIFCLYFIADSGKLSSLPEFYDWEEFMNIDESPRLEIIDSGGFC